MGEKPDRALRIYGDIYLHQEDPGKEWRLVAAALVVMLCALLCYAFWRLYRRTR